MIARILIEYYELIDDEDIEDRIDVIEKLSKLGFKLGIEKELTSKVIKRLFDAEDNEEDRFTNSQIWFDKNIQPLLK